MCVKSNSWHQSSLGSVPCCTAHREYSPMHIIPNYFHFFQITQGSNSADFVHCAERKYFWICFAQLKEQPNADTGGSRFVGTHSTGNWILSKVFWKLHLNLCCVVLHVNWWNVSFRYLKVNQEIADRWIRNSATQTIFTWFSHFALRVTCLYDCSWVVVPPG